MSGSDDGITKISDASGPESIDLTRRQFIAVTTASALLVAAGPAAATAGDKPDFGTGEDGVVVRYDGRRWPILRSMFANRRAFRWELGNNETELRIRGARLPGCQLIADFDARFFSNAGEWHISIRFLASATTIEQPLRTWIASSAGTRDSGVEFATTLRDASFGGAALLATHCTMRVRSDFSGVLTAGATPLVLAYSAKTRPLRLTTQRIEFALGRRDSVPICVVKAAVENDAGPLPLGRVVRSRGVSFEFDSGELGLETQTVGRREEATIRLTTRQGVLIVGPLRRAPGSRIHVEDASVDMSLRTMHSDLTWQGCIARRTQGVEFRNFSVEIRGDKDCKDSRLRFEFGRKARTELKVPATLVGASVPLDAQSIADVRFPHRPVEVWIVYDEKSFVDGDTTARVHVGKSGAVLMLPLRDTRLRVKRSLDLLDLEYELVNYALSCDRNATQLHRIPRTDHLIVVHFPPQHVFEAVFKGPNEGEAGDAPCRPKRIAIKDADLARTRLSDTSRLVFRDGANARRLPLRVAWLTDWRDLALVVNKRALPKRATLPEQLHTLGIKPETDRRELLGIVRESLVAPAAHETAIEPVFRLVVSPDADAKWTTSPGDIVPGASNEVWSARLENRPSTSVRALFSRDLSPGYLGTGDLGLPKPSFTGSMEPDDRAELVVMSSAYGVPAMRRLTPELGDDPNGLVALPDKYYKAIDCAKSYEKACHSSGVPQEGFIHAKAFDRFRMTLSRSATIDALWKGEPPAPYADAPQFLRKALLIQKYEHRTRDGRDVYVEILYKGFLCPTGHRAAVLKLTRREYHPEQLRDGGPPVAYLVQELYVVCEQPIKRYAAYAQPYGSRDFPPTLLELLTTSVQISEPEPPTNFTAPEDGTLCSNGLATVFWPKHAAIDPTDEKAACVQFDYRLDDSKDIARSPLLFVGNVAAHAPETVQDIVKYYNSLAETDERWRCTVTHGGATRRYAPERKRGECSFATASWLLGVRGAMGGTASANTEDDPLDIPAQDYRMDAFMEGQDQPPLYPVMRRAEIVAEPVNRLIGRREQAIEVAFNDTFVRNGFEPTDGSAEIYLDVLAPNIYLDASAEGTSTGGVARPNALLKALSRRLGPVGGRGTPADQGGGLVKTRSGTAVTRTQRELSIKSSLGGQFNPLEYFGSAVSEARLLGIIPLKDILKSVLIGAAPKLVETVTRMPPPEDAARLLVEGARSLVRIIDNTRAAAVQALRDLKIGQPNETAAAMYPVLWKALDSARAVADGVSARVANTNALGLPAIATDLVRAVEAVIDALEDVARDPMPANLRDTIVTVRGWADTMRGLVKTDGKQLLDELLTKVRQELLGALCRKLEAQGVLHLVFGRVESGSLDSGVTAYPKAPRPAEEIALFADDGHVAHCQRFLERPRDYVPRLSRALFGAALGRPLVAAAQTLQDLMGGTRAAFAWSRRELAEHIARIVVDTELRAVHVEVLRSAERIVAKIEQELGELGVDTDVDAAIDRTRNVIDAELRELPAKLHAAATALVIPGKPDTKLLETDPSGYYALVSERDDRMARKSALLAVHGALADSEKIRRRILDDAKMYIATLVREMVDQLRHLAEAKASELIERLFKALDLVLAQVESSAVAAELRQFALDAQDWCDTRTTKVATLVQAVLFGSVPSLTDLNKRLAAADKQVRDLILQVQRVNASDPRIAGIRSETLQALSNATSTLQRVIVAVDHFQRARADIAARAQDWKKICADVGVAKEFLDLTEHGFALRREATEALFAALGALSAAASRVVVLATPAPAVLMVAGAGELDTALRAVVKTVAGILDDVVAAKSLKDLIDNKSFDPLPAQVGRAKVLLEHAATRAGQLQKQITAILAGCSTSDPKDCIDKLLALEPAVADYLQAALLDVLATVAQPVLPAVDEVATIAAEGLGAIAAALGAVDGAVLAVVLEVVAFLDDAAWPNQALSSVLPREIVAELRLAKPELEDEVARLPKIASGNLVDRIAAMRDLRKLWADKRPAVVRVAALLQRVLDAVASGNIDALIDVAALKSTLTDIVADYLPTKVDLAYDFAAALPDFPAGNPIFMMDGARADDRRLENDLVLKTRVTVDLLKGTRTVNAEGSLRPFKIHLLGNSLDLVTLHFNNGSFVAAPGEKPKFSVDIADFKIGSALKFIQALQQVATTGGGGAGKDKNGFYYEWSLLPPEVEVGYRYTNPLIQFGQMTLQNLGFKVSAHLPLDARAAEFRFSFATKAAPFLISAPPYGGGGFVGIRSSARGLIAFEIQFEFGAVVAIAFGPLNGHGRVTAGIYLLSYQDGGRRIEGFVHAIGEGHIACFGASFALEVRMIQTETGSMKGSASYSFSFSLGMFDVSYSVTAEYETKGGGGDGSRSSVRNAAVTVEPAASAFSAEIAVANAAAGAGPKKIRNRMPSKLRSWRNYLEFAEL